jgi:YHS domain-containing protein
MKMIKIMLLSLVAMLLSVSLFAQTTSYTNADGIAIKGYDPVAYFTEQKAVEGKKDFFYDWSGVKWLFSTQAHLDTFKMKPQKFVPQYGGFCAYGTSENHLSPTDPNAWTIVEGKLYLNYNKEVKRLWSKDIPERIKKADAYFPALNQKGN